MPVQDLNEQLQGVTGSLAYMLPELILSGAILLILAIGLFGNKKHVVFNIATMLTAIVSFTFIASANLQTDAFLFNNMLHRDGFTDFLMMLIDVSVILTCLMSWRSNEQRHVSEYYALIVAIALGGHLLLMSSSLVMIFLSLEIISLSS